MELKKIEKVHKLKNMDVQKSTNILDVLVSKNEESQDDADYSNLPKGEFYIDDIIRYTMEIKN